MKFDVFGTFGRTFATLFGRALDILRVIWLPALLQLALFFLLAPAFLPAFMGLSADRPSDAGEAWGRLSPALAPMLLFVAATLALSIILSAGLARLLVKDEKPGLVPLRWGMDEWRILACWGIIAAGGLCVAAAFGVFQFISRLALSGSPIGNLLVLLGSIAIFLAGIWVAVRLCLFTPATIAEQKIGVQVSWEKTEDLFWPMFGFWLILAVLVFILQFATFGLVTPPGYFEAMQQADFRSPESLREAMRNANAALAAGYDLSDTGNVIRMLISFFLNLVIGIVFAVASVVAWKHLADQTPA